MRKLGFPVTVIVLLSLFFTAESFAQGMGGGERRPGSQPSRQYNLSTVETICGEVVSATDTALKTSATLGGSEQLDLVNPGFQVPATVVPRTDRRLQTGGYSAALAGL